MPSSAICRERFVVASRCEKVVAAPGSYKKFEQHKISQETEG